MTLCKHANAKWNDIRPQRDTIFYNLKYLKVRANINTILEIKTGCTASEWLLLATEANSIEATAASWAG